ncbi:MAG: D-sedoheptulose 7-phosphate isomerase [Peptococcaceae bacterium]|nr:D-sedoheptulose 7-phosphate isomerase [Peptococcaceae bacterium]
MLSKIRREIEDSLSTKKMSLESMPIKIYQAVSLICSVISAGNKVMFCGNGGSAAEAQHLATELVSKFRLDRRGLAAVALTDNNSLLTAIANDYNSQYIFARQIEAIGKTGDVLVAISTSGNSKNVLEAINTSKHMGIHTIGLTGKGGGLMAGIVDCLLDVPSDDTPRIQETHIMIGHIICGLVEELCAA